MNSRKRLPGIVQLVMCLALAGMSFAAEPTTQSGPATAHVRRAAGKSAQSYEHATELAVREAVRQAAGVWIDSQTRVENFQLRRDSIYTRARGYVTSYEVTRRWKDENFYYVQIDADVAVGRISAEGGDWLAIQHLIELIGRPDFVVVVEAKGETDAQQVITWIRGVMNDRIEMLGLSAIYRPVEEQAELRDYIKAINSQDMARAKGLKGRLGAPYGIYVTAFSETGETDVYGVKLQRATVNLQGTVVSRSTARILASKQASGVSASRSAGSAVQKACSVAADELFGECLNRIIHNWAEQIDQGVKVEVEATAMGYRELAGLKRHLSDLPDVKSVRIVENDPAGISVIDVRGLINHELIADAILDYDEGALAPEILGPQRVGVTPKQK